MKGDFSSFTNLLLTEGKQYSLVMMQQGRVQLDSDWNAQALTQWFSLQNLAMDLMGEHGGRGDSFLITPDSDIKDDFNIGSGRYYIKGFVCQNHNRNGQLTYKTQRNNPTGADIVPEPGNKYLVYLHAWFQHITSVQDSNLREVALGGPDTTTRLNNIWQVKIKAVTDGEIKKYKLKDKNEYNPFLNFIDVNRKYKKGKLKAGTKKPDANDDPCIVSPESRYRGAENQLYRVEIHRSGTSNTNNATQTYATFKWSRENASVIFPVIEINGNTVSLEHLGRDTRLGLNVGDWVEVVDDNYELADEYNTFPVEDLLQVMEIDRETMQVTLSGSPQHVSEKSNHILLRRWDHNCEDSNVEFPTCGGALKVVEDEWIELEDGVQIMFAHEDSTDLRTVQYNTRDWWWITARAATGDVEWPLDEAGKPEALEPLDNGHRFAPLAILVINNNSTQSITDLRREFIQLWKD